MACRLFLLFVLSSSGPIITFTLPVFCSASMLCSPRNSESCCLRQYNLMLDMNLRHKASIKKLWVCLQMQLCAHLCMMLQVLALPRLAKGTWR